MSVSSLNGYNAYNPLAAALAKSGASASATSQVAAEADTIAKSSSANGTPPDPAAMRTAINKQLASDVSSGTISQDDADKITAALDQLDAKMKAGGGRPSGPPPGGGAGGPPPGGGAGGAQGASSSSSKSALEELTELLKSSSDDEDDSSSSSTSSASSTDLTSYLADLLKSKKVDFSA